jgi:hypothetical protein
MSMPYIPEETRLAFAIDTATELGHTVECDGIGIRRYTCTVCGRALLMPETIVYGSALTEPCTGRTTA